MTFEEYNKHLENVVTQIQTHDNGSMMVMMAITASSLIKTRVIEYGKKADGSEFKPYSTKAMLIGCKSFYKKETCKEVLGSKEKRKQLEWRTVGGSSGFAAYLNVSAGGEGMAGGGGGVRLAILQGGYKKLRELQGYPTDHVNFSISGNMWKNTLVHKKGDPGLLSNDGDHKNGVAIIGPRGEEYKKIMAGNVKRRGDMLDLSKTEQEYLKRQYGLSTLQIFKNNSIA